MGEETMDLAADHAVEAILRDELAREARALAAVVPVLRHLLSADADALVSDAVLARVRGMILDIAAQLDAALAGRDPAVREGGDPAAREALAGRLMGDEALLAHCHALAAESLIAGRLQQRQALDPVLSPLLQELIASPDPEVAGLAMSALAAQSRFVQGQRRMELPLWELPAELFHALVAHAQASAPDSGALVRLQAGYDEAATRIGLLARLVAAMRRGAVAALALDHAGLALFASALAAAARTAREAAVLACHEGQAARLALLLRAAGLGSEAAERQRLLLAPGAPLPPGLAALSPEQAAALAGAATAR
ncbi:hypothetical protein ACLBKU_09665 [Erythrobacter sp. NE805]|uniref:hypothetical protein n=1 Tax=Erythrobacter sp. NE805 TaxID=3389875 RepID=UPI00396AF300